MGSFFCPLGNKLLISLDIWQYAPFLVTLVVWDVSIAWQ